VIYFKSLLLGSLNFILIGLIPLKVDSQKKSSAIYLHILGTLQDGGSPHIGCKKKCCYNLTNKEKENRKVTSFEIFQPGESKNILFEATPDIISQWELMSSPPEAIFITHAHMGHYSGLLHLGREALGSKNMSVYVMPKMASFLKNNAPWSQLVDLRNIVLKKLENEHPVEVLKSLKVIPILVPHRDEFSETVGYKIIGPNKTVLFIPDIDKWSIWKKDLISILNEVDFALIDATFFNAKELNYRPLSEIPHPLVQETIKYLKNQKRSFKNKIYFIHMNHTNPMLNKNSKESEWVLQQGFFIAQIGQQFKL
tara:strand:+ start:259 stop:1191 length:933 start_codon:yes stop_codon:yes gene_type:complete